jgi:hypothetical protein
VGVQLSFHRGHRCWRNVQKYEVKNGKERNNRRKQERKSHTENGVAFNRCVIVLWFLEYFVWLVHVNWGHAVT